MLVKPFEPFEVTFVIVDVDEIDEVDWDAFINDDTEDGKSNKLDSKSLNSSWLLAFLKKNILKIIIPFWIGE